MKPNPKEHGESPEGVHIVTPGNPAGDWALIRHALALDGSFFWESQEATLESLYTKHLVFVDISS
jgi:hypothetical protein